MELRLFEDQWSDLKKALLALAKEEPDVRILNVDQKDKRRLEVADVEQVYSIAEYIESVEEDSNRYRARLSFDVDLKDFGAETCQKLAGKLADTKFRGLKQAFGQYAALHEDPRAYKPKGLRDFASALRELIVQRAETIGGNYWIYRRLQSRRDVFCVVPYLVTEVDYRTETGWREEYCHLSLVANRVSIPQRGNPGEESVMLVEGYGWSKGRITGKQTVEEILQDAEIYLETEELNAECEKQMKLFDQYSKMNNVQFVVQGEILSSKQEYFWDRTSREVLNEPMKAVQDMGLFEWNFVKDRATNLHVGERRKEQGGLVGRVPVHPYILLFSLDRHENFLGHVSDIAPYQYNPALVEKIVLPDSHKDLIDVLVNSVKTFGGDVVEGKSNGTIILSLGLPGTGKTLTAEVYSEVIKKPLYRVHSGQLGTKANEVEDNLQKIFRRNERWGSVLLIDEADVFIRSRGSDVVQNSIVAVFLRLLEYQGGLMFLTSNRGFDIDDAIKSRCIATIRYEIPKPAQAKQIWRILAKEKGIELAEAQIEILVKKMPSLSGRDIGELLKLTGRYIDTRGGRLTWDAIRKCAIFRDIEIVD